MCPPTLPLHYVWLQPEHVQRMKGFFLLFGWSDILLYEGRWPPSKPFSHIFHPRGEIPSCAPRLSRDDSLCTIPLEEMDLLPLALVQVAWDATPVPQQPSPCLHQN